MLGFILAVLMVMSFHENIFLTSLRNCGFVSQSCYGNYKVVWFTSPDATYYIRGNLENDYVNFFVSFVQSNGQNGLYHEGICL